MRAKRCTCGKPILPGHPHKHPVKIQGQIKPFDSPDAERGRVLPCGCVLCVCADPVQCHGCGAKMCDKHTTKDPLVGGYNRADSSPDAETTEEETIAQVIAAARQVQEFLWGKMNADIGLEEVRRMVRKRVVKLDAVSTDNPHWRIEVKKRLLQLGSIAVNFITKIENGKLNTGIHPTLPSNLPDYAERMGESPDAEKKKEPSTLDAHADASKRGDEIAMGRRGLGERHDSPDAEMTKGLEIHSNIQKPLPVSKQIQRLEIAMAGLQDIIDRQASELRRAAGREREAVNALDVAHKRNDELLKQIKDKDEALAKYGRHKAGCNATYIALPGHMRGCNCGFEQALKGGA